MIVSHDHKAVFLHNPKCGGNTIRALLTEYGFEVPEFGDWPKQPGVVDFHRSIVPSTLSDYLVITSCRHPFPRYVSEWAYGVTHPEHHIYQQFGPSVSFRTIALSNRRFHPLQVTYTSVADIVIRLDDLDEDFHSLPFVKRRHTIPGCNASVHQNWRTYYDSELADAVYQKFQEDFDALRYDPDVENCLCR